MKIFNQDKTKELNENELDLENGYLKADKLFIAHHEAVEAQEAIYEKREEKLSNGSTQTWKDLVSPAVEAKEAWDEYEDIQVYIPYTAEELEERRLNALRERRVPLLKAFDIWEKAVLRGREKDDKSVMDWYSSLLNLEESAFENVPKRVRYYA